MKEARSALVAFLLLPVLSMASAVVPAQDLSSRPLRIVVPLSAGAADTLARTIGQKITEQTGQPVVVENRPGAGTTLGTDIAARAVPDGNTLLMATFSHAVNATFYRRLPYDTIKSFSAVTLVASAPNVLEVHPSVPVKTTQDLIALAKAQPGKLNFASAGNGSSSHLAGELFKILSGVNIVHVPYKGAAPAMNDLLGGHVQMTFDPLPSSISIIQAGKLRALAVTTLRRSPALSEVPTLAESGVPDYELNGWSGLLVPAGTPKAVVDRLHTRIVSIINSPDVKSRFTALAVDVVGNTPAEFQAFIRREVDKWGKVVKTANISAD